MDALHLVKVKNNNLSILKQNPITKSQHKSKSTYIQKFWVLKVLWCIKAFNTTNHWTPYLSRFQNAVTSDKPWYLYSMQEFTYAHTKMRGKKFLFLQKEITKIPKSIQIRFFFNLIFSKVCQFVVIVYLLKKN